MGNTKIATMFASHGASGKRRWAALGDGASWMAVIWVQIAKTASRAIERTEPDVHLIKQVEQVTKSTLEGPTWRFARIPSMGVADAVEILVFLIWQLPHWLLFGCKNSQKRPGEPFAKGQSGNAAAPNRRFHEPGPMGRRAVAPPNSVRLIRRDRACRRRTTVVTVGRGRGQRRQPHVFFEMTLLSRRSQAVKPARINFSLVLLRAFSADWPPRWRRGRGHDDTRTRPYPEPPANRAGGSHPDKRDQNSPPTSPPLAPLLHPRHAQI